VKNINAYHPLARLWWLRSTQPAAYEEVAWVCDPKDYLNAMLTGVCASDVVSLARLAAAAATHHGKSLLDAAGIDPRFIPPLAKPISIMGRVRNALPGALARLANVPVVTMAHDTFASAAGLGALRTGRAYNLSGTTEVLGLISEQACAAEGLLTVDWSEGLSQLGGPSLAGGDSLQWLLKIVDGEHRNTRLANAALERLWAMPVSPQPLLFLPYLRGERVPYWDASLRGAWIGLSRDHGPADLARSVFEGVAFLNRIVLERAEAAVGTRVEEIRFGGGGSVSPQWCQIKANVIGRPVVTTDSDEHGLIGAATMAWTALGTQPNLDAAQDALVHVARRYEPNQTQHAAYSTLFALFREAEDAVGPIGRRLAALKRPSG
jgi:xylulokinase